MLPPVKYNADGLNVEAITWALNALAHNRDEYKVFRDYYNGKHKLCFATEKFKNAFGKTFGAMKINLSQLIVDTIAERLLVEGFSVKHRANEKKDSQDKKGPQDTDDTLSNDAIDAWEMNRMEEHQCDLFTEMLRCGESYLIVWPDLEAGGEVVWYPHNAGSCAVQYHTEKKGYIVRGCKVWKEGKYIRLNIYTAKAIEKYITAQEADTLPTEANVFKRYIAKNGAGEAREPWPVLNKWGKCPVFHFPNGKERRSELANLIDPQNAYNKASCDMMVAEEFFAMPQRWGTGVEDEDGEAEKDWLSAADRIWTIESNEARFGQFATSGPEPFLQVRDAFRNDMAIISGIPPYYFDLMGSGVPSGVALQILETRLKNKVRKLKTSAGNVLADAMLLTLKMKGAKVDGVRLKTDWEDTSPKDAKADAETQEVKQRLGVSKRQSLEELGYSPSQIDQNEKDRGEEQKTAGDALGKLFSGGQV